MSRFLLIIVSIFILIFYYCNAYGQLVELSGEFVGSGTTRGKGNVFYSFGLQKVVQQGGDFEMLVALPCKPSQHPNLVFSFARPVSFQDLGIKIEDRNFLRNFAFRRLKRISESDSLIVGHYYAIFLPNERVNRSIVIGSKTSLNKYLEENFIIKIIKIKNFACNTPKLLSRGLFCNDVSAHCSCQIEFLDFMHRPKYETSSPPKRLEKLNGEKQDKLKRKKKPYLKQNDKNNSYPTRNLRQYYKNFQQQAQIFLDKDISEVSIEQCDNYINEGRKILQTIKNKIEKLNAEVESLDVKYKRLDEAYPRLKNLQLRDRTKVIMKKLKEKKKKLVEEQNLWAAKEQELETTLSSLEDYKLIMKLAE